MAEYVAACPIKYFPEFYIASHSTIPRIQAHSREITCMKYSNKFPPKLLYN